MKLTAILPFAVLLTFASSAQAAGPIYFNVGEAASEYVYAYGRPDKDATVVSEDGTCTLHIKEFTAYRTNVSFTLTKAGRSVTVNVDQLFREYRWQDDDERGEFTDSVGEYSYSYRAFRVTEYRRVYPSERPEDYSTAYEGSVLFSKSVNGFKVNLQRFDDDVESAIECDLPY